MKYKPRNAEFDAYQVKVRTWITNRKGITECADIGDYIMKDNFGEHDIIMSKEVFEMFYMPCEKEILI